MRITQPMIELYDRFTHAGMGAGAGLSRRELMTGLARLAGSMAAAEAALGLISGGAKAAPLSAPDDPALDIASLSLPLATGRTMLAYRAQPRQGLAKAPKVLVIHENRGLTDHIRDVTRRLALAGCVAVAADFLSSAGGTPSTGADAEDRARGMIGALDMAATVADGVATLAAIAALPGRAGAPAAMGFCWGGGMVNRLAVAAGSGLGAGIAYYGIAPDLAGVPAIRARMLLHFAGLDERINAAAPPYEAAMTAAGVRFAAHVYPGVNHAFNNDTSAARYDKAAADLAWARSLAWIKG